MYVLIVEGMTCQGCVNSIERNLKAIDQEAEVSVDLLKHEVRVQTKKPLQEVSHVLDESGFNVKEAKRE